MVALTLTRNVPNIVIYFHSLIFHETRILPRDLINMSWEKKISNGILLFRVFKNCIIGKYEEILVNTFHSVKYRVDFLNKYIRKYRAPINYLIGKQALEPLFAIGLVITMIQMSTIIISITHYYCWRLDILR
jgi:hypothetical protein